jgi:mono/diheme cytochrome c family protein
MSKFRRCTMGVLATLVLTSFIGLRAQNAEPNRPFRDNAAWTVTDGVWATTRAAASPEEYLMTRGALADSVTSFEYRAPAGSSAKIYLMGRYAVELPGSGAGDGEWTPVSIRFRAPRFDAGFTKSDFALVIDARVGKDTKRSELHPSADPGARWDGEDFRGPGVIAVVKAPFALRNVSHAAGDFEPLTVPKANGGETNEKDLLDSVALGRQAFEQVGCVQCHLVARSETAMSTGPNLFGLFQGEPRAREVVEGEGHRFSVKATRSYLKRSIRTPADQLAVAESGPTKGEAYLPVMPAYPRDILDDQKIEAIGDYLTTLNDPQLRGPVVKLVSKTPSAPYDPMTDGLQWLVGDEVRLQRGPLPGVSARSIHVGNPNGVNYSFDPRLLAIAKIWQGGFLDMEGELTGRGGRGMKLGHESREIGFGDREFLLAPLQPNGKPIDFSFKEAKFGDTERMKAALNSREDQLAQIAAIDAKFLGYSRDSRSKAAAPLFKYRVGKNVIETSASFADTGSVSVSVSGTLAAPQVFALNPKLLTRLSVSAGKLEGDRWTLPAGKTNATLKATIALAGGAWRPAPSTYAYKRVPLERVPAIAKLPAGYSIENYYPPKDNYGRPQLFEALGLSLAKDGTVVVGTRNAGIWRLVGNEWRLFAEGLFDSLGVVVEDGKGLIVVAGQKAELTRISDTNGDGIADKYETLFDAHSYHGNYHTYLHGPVRAKDGAYYFALNLAHGADIYMGGGQVMGTYGGFNGWAVRVEPDGKYQLFANGLRSPASLGVAPDGRVWYTDNQGDFVGTSKLYELKKDKFYGHPAGLVDLPGMTPASPEIQWDKVAGRKEKPIVLFPHNRVANSPGNPAWVTTPKFGPFAGEILIGDQTQSNLLRVSLQKVGGVEQGSVMPFFEGLESGVMRPLFLPDGSLLLGQTGRGWQAKGGKVASLQHVRWDGKTVAPAISSMEATSKGFTVKLTQPLGAGVSVELLKSALAVESWTYRDAPDYGSPELDLRDEKFESLAIAADRRSIEIALASRDLPQVHPRQLARVYHAKLKSQTLFDANAPAQLDAYYSLLRFPD